jgi:tetratricopeptide (TPR) repeat protein
MSTCSRIWCWPRQATEVVIKRRAHLWFSLAVLAQGAHAAELRLEISPPEPEWLLPAATSPGPCGMLGGLRIEACPTQLLPEGIVEVGEQGLAIELAPLIAAGDYAAILARMRANFAIELTLLEAGDREGFVRTRRPTDGSRGMGGLAPPPDSFRGAQPAARAGDDGTVGDRSPRPTSTPSALRNAPGMRSLPDYISASMLYVIGHSYFSLEQYLPAETAFELVLVAMPNHVRAHESLGMLHLRTERYAEALVHLARAVELGRNTAHVHAALGYLNQKTRRYWAAASAFQRVLVLEPDHRTAQRGLLLALTETREHAKARALVEQLLQAEPDDPELWVYRAHVALASGERASALASLEVALRLGDDAVANRQTCIALHLESGNVARAMELLQGSSARGLEFSLVDRALGWLANGNDWDGFRNLLGSVDRTALGSVEQSRLLTRRASLAVRDGNRRAATAALQEALTLDPSNADALVALGRVYRAERDYARAGLLLQQASDYADVREDALLARAEVAIDEENFEGALTLLRNVALTSSARADVRRNIDVLENLILLRNQR